MHSEEKLSVKSYCNVQFYSTPNNGPDITSKSSESDAVAHYGIEFASILKGYMYMYKSYSKHLTILHLYYSQDMITLVHVDDDSFMFCYYLSSTTSISAYSDKEPR